MVASAALSLALLMLAVALMSMPIGYTTSALYNALPANMRSTGGAVTTFLISVLGFGLGPLSVGMLSDVLHEDLAQESLRYALLLPLVLFPIYVFCLHRVGRAIVEERTVRTAYD